MLLEERRYAPSARVRRAGERAAGDLRRATSTSSGTDEARKRVSWFEPFDELLRVGSPLREVVRRREAERHLQLRRPARRGRQRRRVAYYWEGEPGDRRDDHLRRPAARGRRLRERAEGARRREGHGGRRSTWAWFPELPVAMLACARIGAPHTVVFGGFSADALADRIERHGLRGADHQDEAWRRGSTVPLKEIADEAMPTRRRSKHSVVLRRTGSEMPMAEGRDHWWHELVDRRRRELPAASRWTPRTCSTCSTPRGRPRSRRGSSTRLRGYLVGASTTHHYVFDLKPRPTSTGARPTSAG